MKLNEICCDLKPRNSTNDDISFYELQGFGIRYVYRHYAAYPVDCYTPSEKVSFCRYLVTGDGLV